MKFRESMRDILKELSNVKHKWKENARRFCSVLLCASLVAGSIPASAVTAFAADDDTEEPDYVYEIDNISLIEAIREAVEEGNVLLQELQFLGDASEEYDELFNPDGTLYELDWKTLAIERDSDREKDLNLRIFAHITGDISLDEAYELTGSEEIIFLLQNKSDEEVTAVVYVDGKAGEIIAIPTAEDIEVDADMQEEDIPAEDDGIAEDVPAVINGAVEGATGNASGSGAGGTVSDYKSDITDDEADIAIEDSKEDDPADENITEDSDVKVQDEANEGSERENSAQDDGNIEKADEDTRNEAGSGKDADKPDSEDKKSGKTEGKSDADNSSADENDGGSKDSSDSIKDSDGKDSGSSDKENGKEERTSKGGQKNKDRNGRGRNSDEGSKEKSGEKSASISDRSGNLLTAAISIASASNAEKASSSDAEKASPSDADQSFDCVVYDPVRLGSNGAVAFSTTIEDLNLYGITLLDATQVLEGSGSIENIAVRKDKEIVEDITYTLSVKNVPTNTPISLYSPNVTLEASDGSDIPDDLTIYGNLYYIDNTSGEAQLVAYLMLDNDIEDDGDNFVLTAYGEDGEPLDLDAGYLVINIPENLESVGVVDIWKIQTNKLCYLDDQGDYQQDLIEAVSTFNPDQYTIDEYSEGQVVELEALTGNEYTEFYYGDADAIPLNLTQCEYGVISGGKLIPSDSQGNPLEDTEGNTLSDGSFYMVNDQVYSFDVEINDVVNEHTEDNGDSYLWVGDTFYIDQYHAQGDDVIGYTRSQNTLSNCGVWVQLGRMREEKINGGTSSFSDYKDTTYAQMIAEGVDLTGYDSKNAAETAEENAPYGIVGPFTTTESAPTTSTIRVTGRIGDEFTQTEAFDTDIVYMITLDENGEEIKPETDWINMGSHASDNGYRAWFYWLNDYYLVNNHQDEVEFVEIYQNNDGEVRLRADEMGGKGQGELDDIWEITGLYTKRNSVVKDYMLDNMDELETMGIGFYDYAGWMHHIQLRTNTTVEVVIDGVVYNGTFQILYEDETADDGGTPVVTYKIAREATNLAGDEYAYLGDYLEGTAVLERDNDQETKQYTFEDYGDNKLEFYVSPDYADDPDYVSITVTVHATGTLTAQDGSEKTIVYTTDDPLEYSTTLSAEQLLESIDDCPNNEGYDVAINLADAIKEDNELSIVLNKIWDDDDNSQHSRDDVTYVTVSLERSEDGENWEPVVDKDSEEVMAFPIRGNSGSSSWTATLHTSDGIDITYKDDDGNDQEYYFRIAQEQDIAGVADGFGYTYTLDDDLPLTIMNSLDYTIGITGEKVWTYDKAYADLIPDSVTIGVYQNNISQDEESGSSQPDRFYDMYTTSANYDWKFDFEGLPQEIRSGEKQYEYTLYELDKDGNKVGADNNILLGGNAYKVTVTGGTEETADDESGYTIENSLILTDLQLKKVDGSETSEGEEKNPLYGAEFTLERQEDADDESTSESWKYYKYDDTTKIISWVDSEDEATTLSTDEDGIVDIHDLSTGTYRLTEIKAPDGYNILIYPITIIISLDDDGNIQVTLEDDENTETVTVSTETETGEDGEEKTIFLITVENIPGRQLPKTGGMGTLPFTIIGLFMTAGPALIYLTLRRRRIRVEKLE